MTSLNPFIVVGVNHHHIAWFHIVCGIYVLGDIHVSIASVHLVWRVEAIGCSGTGIYAVDAVIAGRDDRDAITAGRVDPDAVIDG